MVISTTDLMRRATAAFMRVPGALQPAIHNSGIEKWHGRTYVVLRNVAGILAVYRLRSGGYLKRLKRWPTEIV